MIHRIRYLWANFCFTCRYRIARTFKLELPKPDFFQKKDSEIGEFNSGFASAVNVLQTAMQNIVHINESVKEKIDEVDKDAEHLAQIRSQLEQAHAKNAKVISNFEALLGSD